MLSDLLLRSVNDIAPNAIKPVLEEGINDGSIKIPFAKELAEVISLLANVWLNPLVFSMSDEDIEKNPTLHEKVHPRSMIDPDSEPTHTTEEIKVETSDEESYARPEKRKLNTDYGINANGDIIIESAEPPKRCAAVGTLKCGIRSSAR